MKHVAPIFGTICILLLAFGVMPANAQSMEPPTQSEIQTYAAAAVAVQGVAEQYRSKAENAGSQDELDQIRERYTAALREAVESEGISVKRYNEIFQAAQQDPDLAETVSDAIIDVQS